MVARVHDTRGWVMAHDTSEWMVAHVHDTRGWVMVHDTSAWVVMRATCPEACLVAIRARPCHPRWSTGRCLVGVVAMTTSVNSAWRGESVGRSVRSQTDAWRGEESAPPCASERARDVRGWRSSSSGAMQIETDKINSICFRCRQTMLPSHIRKQRDDALQSNVVTRDAIRKVVAFANCS